MKNRKLLMSYIFLLCGSALSLKANIGLSDTCRLPSELYTLQKQYPFLNLSENKIIFPGNSAEYFKQTDISNIAHFGDSHLQADFFGNQLRKDLGKLYGIEQAWARNFIFPYALVPTNSLTDYKCSFGGKWSSLRNVATGDSLDLGLCGMHFRNTDHEAYLEFDRIGNNVRKITLFYSFPLNDTSFNSEQLPLLKAGDGTILEAEHFPESGFSCFNSPTGIHSCRLETKDSNHRYTFYGLYLDEPEKKYVYNTFGVNGAAAYSFVKCIRLKEQLDFLKPQIVVLSFGTNEAFRNFDSVKFMNDYGKLITLIREALPQAGILLCTPGDHLKGRKYANPDLPKAVECIRLLAQNYDCALWDFYRVSGGAGAVLRWNKAGLSKDDFVHLNKNGYELQAELFFYALSSILKP